MASSNQQELTPEELKRIRALLKQDERVTWLWHNIGQAIKWGIIIGGAVSVIWVNLAKLVHFIDKVPK